jgi:hypothetical protein
MLWRAAGYPVGSENHALTTLRVLITSARS